MKQGYVPCEHCHKPRPEPPGPCPRCGDDPYVVPSDLLDRSRYRAKATIALLAIGAAAISLVVWIFRNPGPQPILAQPAPPRDVTAPVQITLPPPPAAQQNGPALKWVFEGKVYDMRTLAPIDGVLLDFVSGSKPIRSTSGKDGSYRVELPPSAADPPYWLSTFHPRYKNRAFATVMSKLEDPIVRNRLANNPDQFDMPDYHLPWIGNPTVAINRDVFLIPDAKPQEEPQGRKAGGAGSKSR